MQKSQKLNQAHLNAKRYSLNASSGGFTLIELLISMAVGALLVNLMIGGLSSYRNNQALNTATETVLAALSDARAKTLASVNDTEYGVYLDGGRVVIFPGTVFSEPDSRNVELRLERPVMIATTSLQTSTSTIVFEKITGAAANYGTITVALRSGTTTNKVVSLSRLGEAAQQ